MCEKGCDTEDCFDLSFESFNSQVFLGLKVKHYLLGKHCVQKLSVGNYDTRYPLVYGLCCI
jgi:hypothetical protein